MMILEPELFQVVWITTENIFLFDREKNKCHVRVYDMFEIKNYSLF